MAVGGQVQRDASFALGHALLRGRYMAAVARMERTGIPIDVPALERIRASWSRIKSALICEVDARYGVDEGSSFRAERFAADLARMGIPWPRLASGAPALDDNTFRDMAKACPVLQPLRELRLACCLATECGIRVCAPVHDALLIEAPVAEIEEHVATTGLHAGGEPNCAWRRARVGQRGKSGALARAVQGQAWRPYVEHRYAAAR